MSLAAFFDYIRRGDLAAVKRTLGANPSLLHGRNSSDQRTALHVAADVGNHLVCRVLLQHGADYALGDAASEVPLMLAARQVCVLPCAPALPYCLTT